MIIHETFLENAGFLCGANNSGTAQMHVVGLIWLKGKKVVM